MALDSIPPNMKVRPNAWHRRVMEFAVHDAGRAKLEAGQCIRLYDGSYQFVQYVNSSGAYIVPLSSITREIAGHQASFTGGGRTISASSLVEVVNPLVMGGNSQEYRRYVRMSRSLAEGTLMASAEGKAGTTFDSFDDTTYHDPGSDLDEADGHTVLTDSETDAQSGDSMAKAKKAKKAASKGNREAAPKKVRDCACGCKTETTGYFAPGHDARYHGWIKKLADGRLQRNGKDAKSGEQVVSAGVLNKMGLVAKGDGFKATTPEWYKD